jgi:hypothetical protein
MPLKLRIAPALCPLVRLFGIEANSCSEFPVREDSRPARTAQRDRSIDASRSTPRTAKGGKRYEEGDFNCAIVMNEREKKRAEIFMKAM